MQENPFPAPDPLSVQPEQPKKSNRGLIIAIVVVLLLCCCCLLGVCGWWLWQNGDSLMNNSGTSLLLNLL